MITGKINNSAPSVTEGTTTQGKLSGRNEPQEGPQLNNEQYYDSWKGYQLSSEF